MNSTQVKAGGKTCKYFRCGKGRHQPDQRCQTNYAVGRHYHKKAHFEVICQQNTCPKKLHSLEDSKMEGSTATRVLDYCDTTVNLMFLGSLEVICIIEQETQDWQEER